MTETILIEPRLLKRQSPAVEQYASLLIRLHEAMHNGDEEEAEEIREQMNTPGILLNEDEIKLVKGLSSDLYMLTGEELLRPSGYTISDYEAALADAMKNGNFLAVLDLLRKKERPFTHYQIAFLRATLYSRLGLKDASQQFNSFSSELAPRFQGIVEPSFQLPETEQDEHSINDSLKHSEVGLIEYSVIETLSGLPTSPATAWLPRVRNSEAIPIGLNQDTYIMDDVINWTRDMVKIRSTSVSITTFSEAA